MFKKKFQSSFINKNFMYFNEVLNQISFVYLLIIKIYFSKQVFRYCKLDECWIKSLIISFLKKKQKNIKKNNHFLTNLKSNKYKLNFYFSV